MSKWGLELAIQHSCLELIRHLSQHNKLPTPSEKADVGAIWLEVRNQEVGAFLQKHGFDIHHKGQEGHTPLDRLIMGAVTTTSSEELSKLESQLAILKSLGATTTSQFWQGVGQKGNDHTWKGRTIDPKMWDLIKDLKRS